MVKREAGVVVDVLTGKEEAKLTLTGVLAGIRKIPSYSIVMDIGGGSTEFIFSEGNKPKAIVSMNFGVVPLTETFVKHDPIERRDLRNLKTAIKRWIEESKERIEKSFNKKRGKGERVTSGLKGQYS